MKSKLFLILILVLGFLFRICWVNQAPPSLNWDEVSHGYNAYSILKTGKDEWGISFPSIFRCFGDFKLPVYIYLTVPSVLFFGLNSISVRLVSIIAGTLTPLIIYLILKKITQKKSFLPFIGLVIAAFSPVTIFLSRIALEANLFLFLFCLSLYFLISQKYLWSSLFFGLGLFTYNSARVLLPFYILFLCFYLIKQRFNFKKKWYQFLPFLLFIILAVYQTLSQSGQARYQWVSILDSGSINQINELRQTYPRFLVNKATYFTFNVGKNYLSHFNPSFLFIKGGSNYQFSLPNFYLLSPLLIPFFILGIFYLIKNIRQLNYQSILFWFLVSPIPSSITRDAPHVLRSIIFIPMAIIIISLGFYYFISKKKTTFFYLISTVLITLISFCQRYTQYIKEYSSSWQYGYQEVVDFVHQNYDEYHQIIFTKKYGEAHEFVLFYWPWDPSSYQNNPNLNWDYHTNWYWVNAFDKFKFINDWEIKDKTKTIDNNTLLITSPGNYNKDNSHLIKTIYFLNGDPAFDILESNNE